MATPTNPIERPEDDPRFTLGLALDVAEVLHQHGYPQITSGMDMVKLQTALFGFLYGRAES
ncbi:hypothetical protein ACIOUE_00690 [Streptomyces xanthochromogenes]|uniref:hypothetical protein n=1 Tax=Streptomyces xanthochromogenes TaxID=67384 RepID=UPI00380A6CBC